MNNEHSNSSLLINSPFALKQWNGVSVLISIETEIAPLSPFAMQCFNKPRTYAFETLFSISVDVADTDYLHSIA